MSRALVRSAVVSYLQGAGITHLTSVYAHPPKITPEGDIIGADGSGTGGAIYVHIPAQHERRTALGGAHSGEKIRPYTCSLICVFRGETPDSETVGANNDDFIDSLTAAIERDRNAGAPSVVWQWGEGDTLYGGDIKARVELPREIDLGITQVFSIVDVIVLEILNT